MTFELVRLILHTGDTIIIYKSFQSSTNNKTSASLHRGLRYRKKSRDYRELLHTNENLRILKFILTSVRAKNIFVEKSKRK